MSRIFASAIFDKEGRPFGIVIFEEGHWQQPIAIMSVQEAAGLADEIRTAILEGKTLKEKP